MTNPLKFFCASARDLKMQTLTVSEIAEQMKPVDEASLRLPRSFAHSLRRIVEEQAANKAPQGTARKLAAPER